MCQCAIMLWCNVHFVADSWRLQCVRKFPGELQCVMKISGDYCVGEIYIYILYNKIVFCSLMTLGGTTVFTCSRIRVENDFVMEPCNATEVGQEVVLHGSEIYWA